MIGPTVVERNKLDGSYTGRILATFVLMPSTTLRALYGRDSSIQCPHPGLEVGLCFRSAAPLRQLTMKTSRAELSSLAGMLTRQTARRNCRNQLDQLGILADLNSVPTVSSASRRPLTERLRSVASLSWQEGVPCDIKLQMSPPSN